MDWMNLLPYHFLHYHLLKRYSKWESTAKRSMLIFIMKNKTIIISHSLCILKTRLMGSMHLSPTLWETSKWLTSLHYRGQTTFHLCWSIDLTTVPYTFSLTRRFLPFGFSMKRPWDPLTWQPECMQLTSIINPIIRDEGMEEQCGSLNLKGCQDALFSLKTALQTRREHGLSTHVLFVDLVKAFDTVNHSFLLLVV